jgi:scyllo-inositol 2-dehydrogenase (NADP+)
LDNIQHNVVISPLETTNRREERRLRNNFQIPAKYPYIRRELSHTLANIGYVDMERTIGVGIASFGLSGRVFHAPLITHDKKFALKHIIERSKDDARKLYPGIAVSKSFEDLLDDETIELVVVNTPDQTHYEFTRNALLAGKHVVVEKPFTQTVAQGEELIALSRVKGLMLTVFHNRRWDGDFLTVQDIIRNKLLGRLVDFESHFDRYRYGIQPDTWKEQADAGAGLVYNLGSHMIDQALVLFGMPDAVTAQTRIVRPRGEVVDWYDIVLHYREHNVRTKSSYLVRELGPRYVLHGTLGSFIKHGLDPQEEALRLEKSPGGSDWGKESQEWWGLLNTEVNGMQRKVIVETKPGNYSAFYADVYDCIVHHTHPPVQPAEALNVIRIIEAAKKSSEERKTIPLR